MSPFFMAVFSEMSPLSSMVMIPNSLMDVFTSPSSEMISFSDLVADRNALHGVFILAEFDLLGDWPFI